MARATPSLRSRALPATVTDLMAQRTVHAKPKLIDEVDKVYLTLYEDPKFRALRGQDDPEKTVEGSIQDDDTCAAQMVREKGIEMNMMLITAETLHEIRLKLRGAERRYNASRKQRQAAQAAS